MAGILDSVTKSMQSASDLTSSAVSKADSVFTGGLKENLALIDSRTRTGIETLNSFMDEQLGELAGLIKSTSSGAVLIKDLAGFIDVRNGFKVDYAGLSRRLGKEFGFPVDAVMNLADDVKKEVLDTIEEFKNLSLDNVMNALGKEIPILGAGWDAASTVADLINKFSDGDNDFNGFIDEASQIAFLNVMVRNAVAIGMYTSLEEFLKQYTRKEIGINNLVEASRIAVRNGDIRTVKEINRLVGKDRVYAVNPNLITEMLMFFRMPGKTTKAEWDGYLKDIETVFDDVNPNWMIIKFGNHTTTNLAPFNTLSDSARMIMQYKDKYREPIMLGGLYYKKDLLWMLREQHPYMAVVQPVM